MSKGIFITATDTDAGKTFVTSLMVEALRKQGIQVGYYKAALSGGYYEDGKLIPGDAKEVLTRAGIEEEYDRCVSYTFETAVSPHLASQIEGRPIKLDKIKRDYEALSKRYEYITVEGSGGIICPIQVSDTEVILLEDIIKLLELPVVIVARAGLGTINHTILTVAYIRQLGIPIKGIILNEYEIGNRLHEDNRQMIERLSKVEVIATIPRMKCKEKQVELDIDKLLELYS